MANETATVEALDRETAADQLSEIADALRSGEDFTVRVGNKEIALTPAETLNYRVSVVEKRRRLRSSREKVSVELDWTPE